MASITFLKSLRAWDHTKLGRRNKPSTFYAYLFRAYCNDLIKAVHKSVIVPVPANNFANAKSQINHTRFSELEDELADTMIHDHLIDYNDDEILDNDNIDDELGKRQGFLTTWFPPANPLSI